VSGAYGTLRFWDASKSYSGEHQSTYGAAALSFWPADRSMPDLPDMLYTLTEQAGYRAVIAVRRADFE
jgi:hypothetical protein